MVFGFRLNLATPDPDKRISFSEAIHPAAGPAASIHLFYSVERAKEMLAQLQTAIAQTEGTPDLDYVEIAGDVYRDFCEADGGFAGTFLDAWIEFEAKHGDIEVGCATEKLILAAMAHALEYGGVA